MLSPPDLLSMSCHEAPTYQYHAPLPPPSQLPSWPRTGPRSSGAHPAVGGLQRGLGAQPVQDVAVADDVGSVKGMVHEYY